MTGSRIVSLGHYQPSRVLTNDDLAQMVETNDAWIQDRVGIADPPDRRRRRRPSPTWPRRRPRRRSPRPGSAPPTSTWSRWRPAPLWTVAPTWPPGSPHKLGISAPAAFDLNTACSGFSYALGTADHAIRAGADAQRPRDRRREAVRPHRLDRPVDRHHLRRRRRRGRGVGGARRRAGRHRPGRLGLRPGEGRHPQDRGLAPVHRAGGPGGVPLGHHRARPDRRCRPASGPASTSPTSPRSWPTRPTCASSTASRNG